MEKNKSITLQGNRVRRNILMEAEAMTIGYLCTVMPNWIKPDHLTALGIVGSLVVAVGLYLAISNPYFLLLSVVGFAIHWFGDSLDGRIAYYRNTPRKWYGWALDINADWISTCIIGLGFYLYFPSYKVAAFLFVIAYGGSMIVALLRYKITNKYQIDAMLLGPTELRIIISLFMILEIVLPGTLWYFAIVGSLVLMLVNFIDSINILAAGDERDDLERKDKMRKNENRYAYP